MRRTVPPADQVRRALERILASDAFARSGRARDLLRYLVEQDLAGNADRLKGFAIGVDVFGKSDRFDPATDTVVRVQAGRLRDFLDQYYAGQGTGDPFRIAVPRGSYVPVYQEAGTALPEEADADTPPPEAAGEFPQPFAASPAERSEDRPSPAPARAGRPAALVLAGLCLVALLAGGIAYRGLAPSAGVEPAETAVASIEPVEAARAPAHVLPTVFIEVESSDPAVERVATALRRGLTGFDTVDFIARQNGRGGPDARSAMDFVFVLEQGATRGEAHLELQHLFTGKALVSLSVAAAGRDQSAIDDEVADLLTSVAPVSGAIYSTLAESGAGTPLTRCLVLNDDFYRDQTSTRHRAAYECFEELERVGLKSPLVHSELSSLHVQALTNSYDYPGQISAQHALRYAQEALRLGPNSPYAHRAMGYVMSRTVNVLESIRWTRKAYELNTFDLGMAAAYGYALVFAGDYDQGTPVLQRAVRAASSHPLWWDYGLFLGQFMLEDVQAAARTVSALAASKRAHYVAARLIVADAFGRHDEAASLLAELQAGRSMLAADPKAFFERGNYPADMADKLVRALRGAGLLGAS